MSSTSSENNKSPIEQLVDQLAEQITSAVVKSVSEQASTFASSYTFGWLEADLAVMLGCSEQTLAQRRRDGEIDSSTNPAGRPFYLPHHVWDYLLRRETKGGKRVVEFSDFVSRAGTYPPRYKEGIRAAGS